MYFCVFNSQKELIGQYKISKKIFTVGSSIFCDFVINSCRVNEKHFVVMVEKNIFKLKCFHDCSVKFFGKKISETQCKYQDYFSIDDLFFCFLNKMEDFPEKANSIFKLSKISVPFLETHKEHSSKNSLIMSSAILLNRLKLDVHKKLVELLDLRRINFKDFNDQQLRFSMKEVVLDAMEFFEFLDDFNKEKFIDEVLDEAIGLGPLESLLRREDVSEIMVNSKDEIFFEHHGVISKSDIVFSSNDAILAAIDRIVAPIGRRIDESSPMVDARLKDGSRVNAIIPPLAIKGPCLTIRKFSHKKINADHLIDFGSMNQAMKYVLEMAVQYKQNLIVSGGTGSGKTTLLNVLSRFIPEKERIITIEDSAELSLHQFNLVSLETKPASIDGFLGITIRDLVKNALRMRPDRIVVGECRGGEALDMLQAMNTGHDGSMTTVHANSPRDCLARVEVLTLLSGIDFPLRAIREQIASAVHLIVQQTRFSCGSRKITSIAEVTGIENEVIQLSEIFKFTQNGFDTNGKVKGEFCFLGVVPEFLLILKESGVNVNFSVFDH